METNFENSVASKAVQNWSWSLGPVSIIPSQIIQFMALFDSKRSLSPVLKMVGTVEGNPSCNPVEIRKKSLV